ncbi:MAG: S8 family peptidase [Candidatus Eisenbacteria bacterium]
MTYRFENIPALSATVPPDALGDLGRLAGIDFVGRQTLVHPAILPPSFPPGLEGRFDLGDVPEDCIVPLRSRPLRSTPLDPKSLLSDAIDPTRLDPSSLDPSSTDPGLLTSRSPDRHSAKRAFAEYNDMTGASDVWEETNYGDGVIVTVIDSGIYPGHPMLDGNVIGGTNLVPEAEEQAWDYNGDSIPDGLSFDWNAIENGSHGTAVSGMVAGHVELVLPADDPFVLAVAANSPGSVEFLGDGTAAIALMGTAPGASLYAVKVFPYGIGSAPDARVAEAIDLVISMKKTGELDTDVINMSLSGPVLNDGGNPLDLLVDAATAAGITVVSAASNEGPVLMSVGSPASAHTGLAVGAVTDPLHARVGIDYLFGSVGIGQLVYPYDEMMVGDFSSRGLTADRRLVPDVVATGFLVFTASTADVNGDGLRDTPNYGFAVGTSLASPTVAGAAALVTAYGKLNGLGDEAPFVANALRNGAIPISDLRSFSMRDQGYGFINLPAALAELEAGAMSADPADLRHVLTRRVDLTANVQSFRTPPLAAGETFDFFVDVPENTAAIEFTIDDVALGADQNPLIGDALALLVHSAKRGASGDYRFVSSPATPGDGFTYEFPEPGKARVTVIAPFSNISPASLGFSMEGVPLDITADYTATGSLGFGESAIHEVDVPAGFGILGVRLSWDHDWREFPTYDLDLFIFGPSGEFVPAATIDSPEMAIIESPSPGTWTFYIEDYFSVEGSENYALEMAFLDEQETGSPDFAALPKASLSVSGPEGSSTLRLEVPVAGRVSVGLFDVGGRRVESLLDRELTAGTHELGVAMPNVAHGIYFLRAQTPAGATVRKVLLR